MMTKSGMECVVASDCELLWLCQPCAKIVSDLALQLAAEMKGKEFHFPCLIVIGEKLKSENLHRPVPAGEVY